MDTVTYPQAQVVEAVHQLVVPVKINLIEQREPARRFGVAWTPTFLLLRAGTDVPSRMWQGWNPAPSFVAELGLGVVYVHLQEKRYAEAEALARQIVGSDADLERRAEARYWQAVAHYRATGVLDNLRAGYDALKREFPDSAAARRLAFPNGADAPTH